MGISEENGLIFDWAGAGPRTASWPAHVMLDDETLRDGLQSPSVTDPPVGAKIEILHFMENLGIETVDVGLPGAGTRQRESVFALCREISDRRMHIRPNCAARTMMVDIRPIAEVSQLTGVPIEACLFIGSSPIRQYAEEWTLDQILRHTREAIRFAVKEGLDVMYVTEDTVRSSPDHLRILFAEAIEVGAKRLCLCDTCGAATPEAVWNLVFWVKKFLAEIGADLGIDWHGHRDRGLDLANTLAAIEAGASRVHGTALGIGERVGNTPMEQLLVNLNLLGMRHDDLSSLQGYVDSVSAATSVPVPANTPVIGRDAFRTATGVHAAAIIKAQKKGDRWLTDHVYSGVPAGMIGRNQEIEIGPMSGSSNVIFYLAERGIVPGHELTQVILLAAKESNRILQEPEILAIVRRFEDVTS
ncbi:MAG TPA: LeuA family protein [Candidatus Dormibacteraeota bacterium]|nr:LeuA family protein [Candidatus Dormibacteraeota bacterium]